MEALAVVASAAVVDKTLSVTRNKLRARLFLWLFLENINITASATARCTLIPLLLSSVHPALTFLAVPRLTTDLKFQYPTGSQRSFYGQSEPLYRGKRDQNLPFSQAGEGPLPVGSPPLSFTNFPAPNNDSNQSS